MYYFLLFAHAAVRRSLSLQRRSPCEQWRGWTSRACRTSCTMSKPVWSRSWVTALSTRTYYLVSHPGTKMPGPTCKGLRGPRMRPSRCSWKKRKPKGGRIRAATTATSTSGVRWSELTTRREDWFGFGTKTFKSGRACFRRLRRRRRRRDYFGEPTETAVHVRQVCFHVYGAPRSQGGAGRIAKQLNGPQHKEIAERQWWGLGRMAVNQLHT